jgi:hypothetical protein
MNDEKHRISFEINKEDMVRFKIRLVDDHLTMSDFFRGVIKQYVENCDEILDVVDEIKKEKNVGVVNTRKLLEKEKKKEDSVRNKFGIKKSEIENIFDILEEEHPDL